MKRIISVLLFVGFILNSFAQFSISKEPYYKKIDKKEEKLVNSYFKRMSPKISLSSFLFVEVGDLIISDSSVKDFIINPNEVDKKYDSAFQENTRFCPHNSDKTMFIDVGLSINFNYSLKQYQFAGADHGQTATLIYKGKKESIEIWRSYGFFPAVDYAIWFGNYEFALIEYNSNYATIPKITVQLKYYNLKTKKVRCYKFPKPIKKDKNDFWDFYFDVYYKRIKL